jgi:CTP synthase (UTP-ammonia lyase)
MSSKALATIRVLGDYHAGHLTHREIDAALGLLPEGVRASWVGTERPDAADVASIDGLWIAPGTPYRSDAAVLRAIRAARLGGVPLLGTCGGFQYAVLEFARDVAGIEGAEHAEASPGAAEAVIAPLSCSLVGKVRMVRAVQGTRLAQIAGMAPFDGFHYCSYGLDEAYVERLQSAGLRINARAEDAGVEGFELPDHPFFLATLFQPQVGSSKGGPLHPLLVAFAEAALAHRKAHAAPDS